MSAKAASNRRSVERMEFILGIWMFENVDRGPKLARTEEASA